MRGPRPAPIAIKKLKGNPSQHRLPDDTPVPPVEIPDPPSYLSDAARENWDFYAPLLAAMRCMAQVDRDTLATWCQTVADYAAACAGIRENGRTVMTAKGYATASPDVRNMIQLTGQIVRLADALGFSPAARSRVKVAKPGEMRDKFDDAIAKPKPRLKLVKSRGAG